MTYSVYLTICLFDLLAHVPLSETPNCICFYTSHLSLCSSEKLGFLDSDQLTRILLASNGLGEELGVLQRIKDNPMPFSYLVHLNQIVFLYCFFLPFQLALNLKFWTVILVGLAVFTFYGLETIGNEIEVGSNV